MTLSAFHSLTRYVTHVPSTYPPYDFLVTGVSHEIPLVGIRDVDPRPPTSTATDSGIRELSHLSGCLRVRSAEWYWIGCTVTCRN